MPEIVSDTTLIENARKDSSAYSAVIAKYAPVLSRYLYRLGCTNPQDREDVLQEIFIKVYVNLNEYDTDLSFSSWIYRIAHNETISFFRKKNVRPQTIPVDEYEDMIPSTENRYELYDVQISKERLLAGLNQLDEKYREVLVLQYFEEKNYEEISDILKKPPNTVATLIRRAKEKLRVILC